MFGGVQVEMIIFVRLRPSLLSHHEGIYHYSGHTQPAAIAKYIELLKKEVIA